MANEGGKFFFSFFVSFSFLFLFFFSFLGIVPRLRVQFPREIFNAATRRLVALSTFSTGGGRGVEEEGVGSRLLNGGSFVAAFAPAKLPITTWTRWKIQEGGKARSRNGRSAIPDRYNKE